MQEKIDEEFQCPLTAIFLPEYPINGWIIFQASLVPSITPWMICVNLKHSMYMSLVLVKRSRRSLVHSRGIFLRLAELPGDLRIFSLGLRLREKIGIRKIQKRYFGNLTKSKKDNSSTLTKRKDNLSLLGSHQGLDLSQRLKTNPNCRKKSISDSARDQRRNKGKRQDRSTSKKRSMNVYPYEATSNSSFNLIPLQGRRKKRRMIGDYSHQHYYYYFTLLRISHKFYDSIFFWALFFVIFLVLFQFVPLYQCLVNIVLVRLKPLSR